MWVANLKVLLLPFWGCRQQSQTVETEDVNFICDFKLLYVYLCIIYSTHFFPSCGDAERFEHHEAARRQENPIYWQGR